MSVLIFAVISIVAIIQAPALAFLVLPVWLVVGCCALKVHLMERHQTVQGRFYQAPLPAHWSPEWHKQQRS